MALSTDILLGVPYNVGGTLREVDASTVVDNVFTFSSNGKKWQRVFDGGNSVYRASWLNITGAPVDKTALLAIAVANSSIQTLEVDATIQIDGAVDFAGKTLSVKSGGLVTGTYAISNAVIEGNLTQKILEPTGTLTTSKSATGKWHPTHFGAKGDGMTDDYTAVNFTVGVANTNEQKIVELIPGNYLLGTNLSVPSGVTLEFSRGSYLTGSTTTISGAGDFISPNSLVFGTGITPSGFNYLGDQITPQHFGAIGNNSTNDSPAFQRMWDYVATLSTKIINIFIPPRTYYTPDTIFLPKTNINGENFIKVSGYGAVLRTDTDSPIWSRHPASTAESNTCIGSYKAVIEGVRFWGNSTSVPGQTSQIGLDIGSTYTWIIKDCFFYRLYIGIKALFWLNGKITDCHFTQQRYCDIMGRYGDWTGASSTNSAFNANIIEGCRFYSLSGSFTTVYLLAADQTIVRNCISEGDNPVYNFYMDYDGSTGVLLNTYDSIWIESVGGVTTQCTNFYLRARQTVFLKNIQRISPNRLFELAATSHAAVNLVVDGIPYISNIPTSGLTFFSRDGSNAAGHKFTFRNIQTNTITPIEDPANWDGGTIPSTIYIDLFTDNGAGSTIPIQKSATGHIISSNSILLAKQVFGTSAWRGVYVNPPTSTVAGPPYGQSLIICTDDTSALLPAALALGKVRTVMQYGSNGSNLEGGNEYSCIYVNTGNTVNRCPIFSGVRARGTLAALLAVVSGTILRVDRVEGYDGTATVVSGLTVFTVDGTPATGIVPTSWEVRVMNSAGSIVIPLKIRASGQIELAVAPAAGALTDGILTLTSGGALRQIATSSIIGTGVINTLGYFDANGGAIKSLTAITASRALKSDANGLPIAFDTATEPSLTELTYVKGVTSPIQSQLGTKGLYATNGDGVLTVFTVTHGFTGTPTNIQVTPAGVDSAVPFFVNNITGTTFDVTFTTPPIVGTNNVTFYWTAK